MALRSLVTRMRSPASSFLRLPPAVSRGSPAAGTRPFATAPQQGAREDMVKMNARKNYEFYLGHLERCEHDLEYMRVFTKRCEMATKLMSRMSMVVFPAHFLMVVAQTFGGLQSTDSPST